MIGSAELNLLTDGRSLKPEELAIQRAVELCWLLLRARCQFRLRGSRLFLPAELEQRERQRHWQELTPGGRALWGWPPPAAPLDLDALFPEELPDDTAMSAHFHLLRLSLEQVELLELTHHPHRRRRWRAEMNWKEQRLNP